MGVVVSLSLEPYREPKRKPALRLGAHAQLFEGDVPPAVALDQIASDSPHYAADGADDEGRL